MLGRRIGKRRDGARMTERERHPHVDHVGDRQIGLLASLLVEHRMGSGLQRQDRLAVDGPVEPREQSFGMGEEKIGQLRFVAAAGALGDHRGHGLEAMVPRSARWHPAPASPAGPETSPHCPRDPAAFPSRPSARRAGRDFRGSPPTDRSAPRSSAQPRSARTGWERSPAWPRQGRAPPPWPAPQAAHPAKLRVMARTRFRRTPTCCRCRCDGGPGEGRSRRPNAAASRCVSALQPM